MTMQDEEFIRRLRATFAVEADEHVQAISAKLLELEKAPSTAAFATSIETAFREAHSLKGAARAVDFNEIESVCQALESVFGAWKQRPDIPPAEAFDKVHRALDEIRALMEPGRRAGAQSHDLLIRQLGELQSGVTAAPPRAARPVETTPPPPAPSLPPQDASRAPPPVDAERHETVRISITKLEGRLRQAEDLLAVKSLGRQHATDLRALSESLKEWRKKWSRAAGQMQVPATGATSPESLAAADLARFLEWNSGFVGSLEARLATLAAQAQRDRHVLDRRVDDLLEDSKKLLMLPLSTITGGFAKLVRDLCREQNKDAQLTLAGEEVEIDKRILEEMKDVLTHVLRNCVDHGVETPADRMKRNKPPRATLAVRAAQINGSKVEIVVSDDGAGVNVERVKASAVQLGILAPAQAEAMDDAAAVSLVFQSQVTTSAGVTSISGRGLGMAIVRSKVESLDGRVELESRRHAGTTLRMILPLTMATFRGVLADVGSQVFVVPAANVERVLRVAPADVKTVENREVISVAGQALSLVRLGPLLEIPPARTNAPAAFLTVLILQAMGQRIGFACDGVLDEQEVLVKPFRKPLARVRHFVGATILANGKVAPVLNVSDLMQSARLRGAPPSLQPAAAASPRAAAKRILVVEDSITSRMMIKGILTAAGFDVKTAVDGMEAYALLREDSVDLVVSDVEMPRLNGFDLTARIRADKRLAELPVILVTALESREQRERGLDAGASAYIVKSNFEQTNLLDVIRRLI